MADAARCLRTSADAPTPVRPAKKASDAAFGRGMWDAGPWTGTVWETGCDVLGRIAPGDVRDQAMPADADPALQPGMALAGYDAVILTGTPPLL